MALLDQQASVYLDTQIKSLPNNKITKIQKNKNIS